MTKTTKAQIDALFADHAHFMACLEKDAKEQGSDFGDITLKEIDDIKRRTKLFFYRLAKIK